MKTWQTHPEPSGSGDVQATLIATATPVPQNRKKQEQNGSDVHPENQEIGGENSKMSARAIAPTCEGPAD